MSGYPSAAPRRASCRFRGAAPAAVAAVLAVIVLGLAGCAGTQHLGDYEFRQKTLDVATIAPPYPEVLSSLWVHVDRHNALESLIRAGAAVARQVSAEQARARLDSAAARVDVPQRMGDRLLQGASRQLRTQPVKSPERGDFELEVRIRRYGIEASSWNGSAYYMIDADLAILDGATGRRIWKQDVKAREPVGPRVFGAGRAVSNVVTAASLSGASVEQMQRALEDLADFAADTFTGKLADALDKVRG